MIYQMGYHIICTCFSYYRIYHTHMLSLFLSSAHAISAYGCCNIMHRQMATNSMNFILSNFVRRPCYDLQPPLCEPSLVSSPCAGRQFAFCADLRSAFVEDPGLLFPPSPANCL